MRARRGWGATPHVEGADAGGRADATLFVEGAAAGGPGDGARARPRPGPVCAFLSPSPPLTRLPRTSPPAVPRAVAERVPSGPQLQRLGGNVRPPPEPRRLVAPPGLSRPGVASTSPGPMGAAYREPSITARADLAATSVPFDELSSSAPKIAELQSALGGLRGTLAEFAREDGAARAALAALHDAPWDKLVGPAGGESRGASGRVTGSYAGRARRLRIWASGEVADAEEASAAGRPAAALTAAAEAEALLSAVTAAEADVEREEGGAPLSAPPTAPARRRASCARAEARARLERAVADRSARPRAADARVLAHLEGYACVARLVLLPCSETPRPEALEAAAAVAGAGACAGEAVGPAARRVAAAAQDLVQRIVEGRARLATAFAGWRHGTGWAADAVLVMGSTHAAADAEETPLATVADAFGAPLPPAARATFTAWAAEEADAVCNDATSRAAAASLPETVACWLALRGSLKALPSPRLEFFADAALAPVASSVASRRLRRAHEHARGAAIDEAASLAGVSADTVRAWADRERRREAGTAAPGQAPTSPDPLLDALFPSGWLLAADVRTIALELSPLSAANAIAASRFRAAVAGTFRSYTAGLATNLRHELAAARANDRQLREARAVGDPEALRPGVGFRLPLVRAGIEAAASLVDELAAEGFPSAVAEAIGDAQAVELANDLSAVVETFAASLGLGEVEEEG